MFFFLFLLVLLLSLYDLLYRTVPNWITLPLICLGLYLHLPGDPVIWFASAVLFSAWKSGFMGGGDAKLWMGLLWCLSSLEDKMVLWMFAAFMLTGLAQIIVRALSQKRLGIGFKTAGVWRAVVFMGLLAYLQ